MPVLLIALGLVVLILMIGFLFAAKVIYPKCYTVQETYDMEVSGGRFAADAYAAWEKEEVEIASPYGYKLYGQFFPWPGSKLGVILTHGITFTLFGSVKYMPIFRKLGFNILIYDNRYHGRSGGPNCTFGFYEKNDLKVVLDWMIARLGPDCTVGTHGESMGASISLQHSAIDSRPAFVIEDCGFSSLLDQLAYRLKVEFHLPPRPLLPLAGLLARGLSGMVFEQVSPIQTVGAVQTPILFIHGDQDDYVPTWMGQALYERKTSGARRLYLAPHAGHALAYYENQEEYAAVVREFLIENHII